MTRLIEADLRNLVHSGGKLDRRPSNKTCQPKHWIASSTDTSVAINTLTMAGLRLPLLLQMVTDFVGVTTPTKTSEQLPPKPTAEQHQERQAYLKDAQQKAIALFSEIERTLVRPGISEKTLSNEIHDLGFKRYGIQKHWHKRVVRSGANTLRPYIENPPDRVIEADDILYVDLGPVFEAWEADFGRTFVLGSDTYKHRLRDHLEPTWNTVKAYFDSKEDITGEQLYDFACQEAERAGYQFGAELAGHLIGCFPHERIPRDKISLYIIKGNKDRMKVAGADGFPRHWILEIHLHDRERQYGGFMEKLLTIE